MWLKLLFQPCVVLYGILANEFKIISIVLKTAGQRGVMHDTCVKVFF